MHFNYVKLQSSMKKYLSGFFLTLLIILVSTSFQNQFLVKNTYAQTCSPLSLPPNNSPTVTLREDGYTLDIEYSYTFPEPEQDNNDSYLPPSLNIFQPKLAHAQAIVPKLKGDIHVSTQKGFADSGGTEIGTQFGKYGTAFDRDVPDQRTLLYYQAKVISGNQTGYSNTYAVISERERNRNCGGNFSNSPRLVGTENITTSGNNVTFDLIYTVDALISDCDNGPCNPSHTPSHLVFQSPNQSTPGYVPWNSGVHTVKIKCSRGGGNDCEQTTWKATYTIDLPPNTTRNFTITGFRPECSSYNASGQATLVATTTDTSNPEVVIPVISVNAHTDGRGNPYNSIIWSQSQPGEQIKVYEDRDRWTDGTKIRTTATLSGRTWTFKATEDLREKPAGNYYYGAEIDMYENSAWCGERYVKTDQTLFTWNPPACSGNVTLRLNPPSATIGQTITATASGLSFCAGKTVNFKQGQCTGSTDCADINSCQAGTNGCSVTFTSPQSTNTKIWAFVDINGNGNTNSSGEKVSADLTVNAALAGDQVRKKQETGDQVQNVFNFTEYNIYNLTDNLTINGSFSTNSLNKSAVVFINKNLNIDSNITTTNDNSGLVFVVKGNVNINPSVDRIDAVIISEGLIYTAGADCTSNSVTTSPLTINGSLVSTNQTSASEAIKFCRTLSGTQNTTTAAEKINHQVKYLPLLRNLFSYTYQKWSEVP